MSRRLTAVALAVVLAPCLVSAQGARSQPSPPTVPAPRSAERAATVGDTTGQDAEVRAVEASLVAWYDAIRTYDFEAVESALTPTFLILEDRTPLDAPALLERLRAGKGQGSQVAVLSDLRTRVRGEVAWTTLRNDETWTPTEGAVVHLEFLETVVFVKEGGRWRIDRYHAQRIGPAKQ